MSRFNVVLEATLRGDFVNGHRWKWCRPSGALERSVGFGPGAHAPGYIMPPLRGWFLSLYDSSPLLNSTGWEVSCPRGSRVLLHGATIEPTASSCCAPRAIFGHPAGVIRGKCSRSQSHSWPARADNALCRGAAWNSGIAPLDSVATIQAPPRNSPVIANLLEARETCRSIEPIECH
jgi:hypothetical protein